MTVCNTFSIGRFEMTKKIFTLGTMFLLVMGMFAGLASPASAVVAFFDNFETDEGGDGFLDGDTSTSGHTWGNSIVGIVEMVLAPGGNSADQAVGATWAWGSTNGAGTSAAPSPWTGNAAQFTKVTTGTWYWSMDVKLGATSHLQPVLRDTPDASGAVDTNTQTSSWFVTTAGISHEGFGAGGGNIGGSFATFPTLAAGNNVHVEFVYDLDAQTVNGSWFDNNNPSTNGLLTELDYSSRTKLEPNAFDLFTNSGAGDMPGIDNLRFADTSAIPEPTSLVLLCLGGLAILCGRRRRRG
jgi:hypothetical protein